MAESKRQKLSGGAANGSSFEDSEKKLSAAESEKERKISGGGFEQKKNLWAGFDKNAAYSSRLPQFNEDKLLKQFTLERMRYSEEEFKEMIKDHPDYTKILQKLEESKAALKERVKNFGRQGKPKHLFASAPPTAEDEERLKGLEIHSRFEDPELTRKFLDHPPISADWLQKMKEKYNNYEKCACGNFPSPYCHCISRDACTPSSASKSLLLSLSPGASEEHRHEIATVRLAYQRQLRQSHCFDIDDYPGAGIDGAVFPLSPNQDFDGKGGLFKELAEHAIKEYNDKGSNDFKYEVKKVEKVNILITAFVQYFMTVRVGNLTLGGTSSDTFQIHAGYKFTDEKLILCCRPKEEVIVGLGSCNFCHGKLRKSDEPGVKEA